MEHVHFVDTTIRDGHQSLWAERMSTGMMLPIAKSLNDAGFEAIELLSGSHIKKAVRELREDPWEMNVHAVHQGETAAAAGHYAHVPSMLQDVRSQRPTEVEFITGSLVHEADRLDVSVPLHTAMYQLVRAREAAYR